MVNFTQLKPIENNVCQHQVLKTSYSHSAKRSFKSKQQGLTIFMDVGTAFPIRFTDIFKGQQKQHNFPLLVFNWDNIQETPKLISCEYQNRTQSY